MVVGALCNALEENDLLCYMMLPCLLLLRRSWTHACQGRRPRQGRRRRCGRWSRRRCWRRRRMRRARAPRTRCGRGRRRRSWTRCCASPARASCCAPRRACCGARHVAPPGSFNSDSCDQLWPVLTCAARRGAPAAVRNPHRFLPSNLAFGPAPCVESVHRCRPQKASQQRQGSGAWLALVRVRG